MSVNVTFFVVDCYREITGREVADMAGKGSEVGLKYDFTMEERQANGRKGGVKSGETRRRQRTFRESVNAILNCQVQEEEQRKALEAVGIDPTMLNQIQLARVFTHEIPHRADSDLRCQVQREMIYAR